MGKKKKNGPNRTLHIVPDQKGYSASLLDHRQGAELKALIREINSKAEMRKDSSSKPHTEHDPDLPPAA